MGNRRFAEVGMAWSGLVTGVALAGMPANACSVAGFAAASPMLDRECPIERSMMVQSFDWHVGRGMAYVNARGMIKTALAKDAMSKPAEWVATLGSVSFSPTAREFIVGGVNEEGLAVAVMQSDPSTLYPDATSSLPVITELQWPQYILDTSASLKEAIEQAKKVRVSPIFTALHYFICDSDGFCGAFEYVDGKLLVHGGDQLPAAAFTNSTYGQSIAALKAFETAPHPMPTDNSLLRFVRLSQTVRNYPTWGDPVDFGFYALSTVHQDSTRWNFVYDRISSGCGGMNVAINFRTSSVPVAKRLSLAGLDFDCRGKRVALDLDSARAGDVPLVDWVPYTDALVKKLDAQNTDVDPKILAAAEGYAAAFTSCPIGP